MKKSNKYVMVLGFLAGALAHAATITDLPTSYSAVVRNNLTITNAPALPNAVLVGGAYSGPGTPAGSIGGGIADWYKLTDFSSQLSTPSGVGTTEAKWGGIYLDASPVSGNAVQVFNLDAKLLAGSTYFSFSNGDAGSTVILNIFGENVSMSSSGWSYGGFDPAKLILNFVDAKTLTISGMEMGTILAPKANVSFTNGTVGGTIVADQLFLSSVGMKNGTYAGTLPGWDLSSPTPSPETATPEPSSLLLMGTALIALTALRKGRRSFGKN